MTEIDNTTKCILWKWANSNMEEKEYVKTVLCPNISNDITLEVTMHLYMKPSWCEIEVWNVQTQKWICDIHVLEDSKRATYRFSVD